MLKYFPRDRYVKYTSAIDSLINIVSKIVAASVNNL